MPDDVASSTIPFSPAKPAAAIRLACLGWLLLAGAHYFILSAGGVWPLPSYSAYYNRLADGFSHGQTSLILKPVPGLLALPDPYNPVANRPYRRGVGVHDTLLYDGKFYLYWGPAPAIIIAGLKSVHLIPSAIVGDEWLVLGFVLLADAVVAMLLYRLWSRCFHDRSPGVLFVGLLVYGLASPTTYFLARPAVYEAAIAGGQCFLLAGIWLAWTGIDGFGVTQASSLLSLFTGGVSLALAVSCRVSLAIAVVGIGLIVCCAIVVACRRLRRSLPTGTGVPEPLVPEPTVPPSTKWTPEIVWGFARLAAFGLPLIAGAALLAGYNHARFGQYLEFGQKYQLGGANYHAVASLFGAANATPSLWSYLVRPPAARGEFPFLRAQGGHDAFPDSIALPPHYESDDPIAGLLWTTPVVALALVPLLRLRRRDDATRSGRLIMLLLAVGGLLGFAPCLFLIGSTQRYLFDLWPTAAVLTTMGLWQMPRMPARCNVGQSGLGRRCLSVLAKTRIFVAKDPGLRGYAQTRALWASIRSSKFLLVLLLQVLFAVLLAQTIAVGFLLGFSGYYDHFRTWNPSLYQSLGGKLPTWDESPTEPLRLMEGRPPSMSQPSRPSTQTNR